MNRRRLRHDPIPPPPDQAHGPGECVSCRRVITMHTSGRCHWCSDWATPVDACSVEPGDVVYDWLDWSTVAGVARDGDTVRIALEGRPKPLSIGALSAVWVARDARRTAA